MTPEQRAAMELGLKALKSDPVSHAGLVNRKQAITALTAALEQPAQQEPVAWMTHSNDMLPLFHKTRAAALNWQTQPTPLYTRSQAREPLSDTQILAMVIEADDLGKGYIGLARAIEAAHGIGEKK